MNVVTGFRFVLQSVNSSNLSNNIEIDNNEASAFDIKQYITIYIHILMETLG